MGIDPNGYRLVTGAKNGYYKFFDIFYFYFNFYFKFKGSVKVWDFGAGQELKHMNNELYDAERPNENLAIVDVYYVKIDEELLIAVLSKDNKINLFLVRIKNIDFKFR